MPFQFDTVANIISDAAIELKLIQAPIADPFDPSVVDPNIIQLRALLKTLGRELNRDHGWTYLRNETTFNTQQNISSYPLPVDFRNMVEQSGWNRTDRLPLGGPLDSQEWQFLQAMPAQLAITVMFRPWQGKLFIYPPPGATPKLIAYEYMSTYWIADAGTIYPPTKDTPTTKDQVIMFDALLMVRGLKFKWLGDNGFDTTTAEQEFTDSLEKAKSDNTPSKVLRIDGRSAMTPKLLDDTNIPFTGFGNKPAP